jgi:membrane protease YdiL (CAAX protease family)
VDDPTGTPIESGPISDVHTLRRYRALQVGSILLIVAGVAALWFGLGAGLQLDDPSDLQMTDQAVLALTAVALGAIAVVVGLITNAVRAMVVRERLPESRYRGPSAIVLLLIGNIITVALTTPYFADLISFQQGDQISVVGALVILTGTQAGLLAAAIVFVALPNALAGVRLLPSEHGARTILIGLAVSIPAWIAAAGLGLALTQILAMLGREPQPGVVDQALAALDPAVLIVAIVVIAPIAEEVFFRGVVFNAWRREHGERRALFGSAALFATIHANTTSWDALVGSLVISVPVIFGLGIALALVYRRTGSLAASIAMHAGFNAISLTLALLARLYGWDLPT